MNDDFRRSPDRPGRSNGSFTISFALISADVVLGDFLSGWVEAPPSV
jgi:hypothetical protein